MVAVSLAAAFPACAWDNLLQNPGFEDGTAGWTEDGGVTFTFVGSAVHGGSYAACLVTGSMSSGRIYQVVPVSPATDYTLNGWGQKVSEDTYAQCCLEIRWYGSYDGYGEELERRYICCPGNESGYHFLTAGTVWSPIDAHSARIMAVVEPYSGEPVTAYFDDFSFEGPSPTNTPTSTPAATSTPISTPTSTVTPTPMATATVTAISTPTSTSTPTPVPSPTPADVPTTIPTPTPVSTYTPIPSPTPTPIQSSTHTPDPTLTPTPNPTFTPSPSMTPLPVYEGDVVINEFQYDTVQGGNDAHFEWLELLNRTGRTISLANWRIEDNSGSDYIPGFQLSPGGFAVLAASDDFYQNFPNFTGDIAFIYDGAIGGGLSNSGDRIYLLDSTGKVIDAVSYGSDEAAFSPSCPNVAAGHSLERRPAGFDTNKASDFVDNGNPTPGLGLVSPTPTQFPTEEPAVTATATPDGTSQDNKEDDSNGTQNYIPKPASTPTVVVIPGFPGFYEYVMSSKLYSANLPSTPAIFPLTGSNMTASANETAASGEDSPGPWFYLAMLLMAVTWMASHTLYFRYKTQG